MADLGCRLIYQGKYSEGETYANRAARLNSQPPIWHAFCLFLAAYNTGNFTEAAQVADTLEGHPAPEASIPVIIMAMRDGKPDKARAALKGLVAYDPSVVENPNEVLAKIGLFPDISKPLADQLMLDMIALNK